MNKSIPAYGIIAQNDTRYTLEFRKEIDKDGHCTTGRIEGYSMDVFRDIPADTPVMDWREATGSIVQFIFKFNPPIEVWNVSLGARLTMKEYFAEAEKYGCKIKTVKEILDGQK